MNTSSHNHKFYSLKNELSWMNSNNNEESIKRYIYISSFSSHSCFFFCLAPIPYTSFNLPKSSSLSFINFSFTFFILFYFSRASSSSFSSYQNWFLCPFPYFFSFLFLFLLLGTFPCSDCVTLNSSSITNFFSLAKICCSNSVAQALFRFHFLLSFLLSIILYRGRCRKKSFNRPLSNVHCSRNPFVVLFYSWWQNFLSFVSHSKSYSVFSACLYAY